MGSPGRGVDDSNRRAAKLCRKSATGVAGPRREVRVAIRKKDMIGWLDGRLVTCTKRVAGLF